MREKIHQRGVRGSLIAGPVPISDVLHAVLFEKLDGVIFEALVQIAKLALGRGVSAEFKNAPALAADFRFGRIVGQFEKITFHLLHNLTVLFAFLRGFLPIRVRAKFFPGFVASLAVWIT